MRHFAAGGFFIYGLAWSTWMFLGAILVNSLWSVAVERTPAAGALGEAAVEAEVN